MSIYVRCPSCRKRFSTSESSEGRSATCPECGDPFTVCREKAGESASVASKKTKADLVDLAIEEEEEAEIRVASVQPTPRRRIPGGKFCSTCGEPIHVKAEICPHCGVRQSELATEKKSRTVACLLAIFLGGLGAHKFYLGHTGTGVVYLLVSILGFPFILPPLAIGIISLVEGLIYLGVPSDSKFTDEYAAKS